MDRPGDACGIYPGALFPVDASPALNSDPISCKFIGSCFLSERFRVIIKKAAVLPAADPQLPFYRKSTVTLIHKSVIIFKSGDEPL